ncbi:MAG: hypothetical protein K6G89_02450 [Clostridia bacterium]|nr:hypothetical protein [Clostridia bacterium]
MSRERIQNALNKWKVDILPGDHYRFMDANDPGFERILKAFEIGIRPKLYRRSELNIDKDRDRDI